MDPNSLLHAGYRVLNPRSRAASAKTDHSPPSRIMVNVVSWEVTSRGYCKKRRFEGTYRLHHQGEENRLPKNVLNGN
jgi:hypothetical protein